ncbi:MAG: hypothetical protein AAFQ42_07210 [Pseudomonadota bacterium]
MAADKTRNQGRESAVNRTLNYIFGRNILIGVAALMLLAISGFATWSGMNDFIVGVSQTSTSLSGPGGLAVSGEWLVIAITVALTFLMWLALRESFGAGRWFRERAITFPLYLFLALWSVGFGYGFWWSLIAGEEATRTSLAGLQEDARDAGGSIAARLDAVRVQIDSVAAWSETQMAREERSGGSCGRASGAGRGPLYNARVGVRDAISSLRDNVTTAWIGPTQSDLDQLRRSATRLEGENIADRQQTFERLARDIRGRARNIAARSNEFGKTVAAEMNALADSVSIAPGEAGFSCYDPTLAQRLRLAADQANQPAELALREAAFNEGPAGVANAVKGLWSNIGAGISDTARWVASGFQPLAERAGTGVALTGRDLIALLATLGIDLGLFVLTALNPPSNRPNRIDRAAAVQIRDAIRVAASRAPGNDAENLDWIQSHFINHDIPKRFSLRGKRRNASWFVIPNLYHAAKNAEDGSLKKEDDEAKKALALNHLAGVLGDLGLIRWPTRREFKHLVEEEQQPSGSDLSSIRKKFAEENGLDTAIYEKLRPIRNHGLFSKAEAMLASAGWSEQARADVEVFRLIDTEGLTPILSALNTFEQGDDKKTETTTKAAPAEVAAAAT